VCNRNPKVMAGTPRASDTSRAKVAIVGGDPVLGGALEVLLQAAGYRARFLSVPVVDKPDELLAGFQLLIVAPALSAERRKALLDVILNPTAPVKIPVLELLPANGGEQHVRGKRAVLWPCPMEGLKRAIDALLEEGTNPSSSSPE
jgi:hypothetical protein